MPEGAGRWASGARTGKRASVMSTKKQAGKANIIAGALVVVVLIVALVAMFAMRNSGTGELRAVVHASDGQVYELPLSEDAEQTVATDLGTNVVVVERGSVFVREADCDNQDCVHQGTLDAPGHQIICLPHKLWIEVVAQGDSGGTMDVGAAAGSEELDVVSR